jgi:hypothetical protein
MLALKEENLPIDPHEVPEHRAPETEIVESSPDLAKADWAELFSPKDLTEADWSEMDKLKHALETGGQEALEQALAELRESDSICFFRIIRSFFPRLARKLWLRID